MGYSQERIRNLGKGKYRKEGRKNNKISSRYPKASRKIERGRNHEEKISIKE